MLLSSKNLAVVKELSCYTKPYFSLFDPFCTYHAFIKPQIPEPAYLYKENISNYVSAFIN